MKTEKSVGRLTIHYRAAQRLLLWHLFSKRLPLYPVTEFPKCGGTWFCQMLSDVLDLPFARNLNKPSFKRSIIHGHHGYSKHFYKPVTVLRDGRDAIVSAYFHFLFRNEVNSDFGVQRTRAALQFDDYEDVKTNLPAFIDYMFTKYNTGNRVSWTDFVMAWHDKDCLQVRYEDLLVQPGEELLRTAHYWGFDKIELSYCKEVAAEYTFEKMSGRKRGQSGSKSFVRKGVAGDWVNVFSLEAKERFHYHAGEALKISGYETDDSWVQSVVNQEECAVDV